MPQMRLDKFLTHLGCGSRRAVGAVVRAGRVCVNGTPCRDPAAKIRTETDAVSLDGAPQHYETHRYYMLHKPQGVVSATKDNMQPTVLSLLPEELRRGLFPVGRLDVDTEGLLLLTDDGALAHALTAPRRHVDKRYLAHIRGTLEGDAARRFAEGITLADGEACRPAVLEVHGETAEGLLRAIVTLHEGKFHQVKRMVRAVGGEVVYLKRLSMGALTLDEGLALGAFRPLTQEELALLRAQSEN